MGQVFTDAEQMKWLSSLIGEEFEQPAVAVSPADAPAFSGGMNSGVPLAPERSPDDRTLPDAPGNTTTPKREVAAHSAGDLPYAGPVSGDEAAASAISDSGPDTPALHLALAELNAAFAVVSAQQQQLNGLFASRLRSDEAQARAVEKLHEELRQYKSGFVRQQMLPLLKEVVFCHDFVSGELARQRAQGCADEPGAPLCALEVVRQMLLDVLFKYDVEPYRGEGELFDPKTQQCTQTVPADRAELDRRIASRGLEGFRGPDGIVRREQVTVYKAKEMTNDETRMTNQRRSTNDE